MVFYHFIFIYLPTFFCKWLRILLSQPNRNWEHLFRSIEQSLHFIYKQCDMLSKIMVQISLNLLFSCLISLICTYWQEKVNYQPLKYWLPFFPSSGIVKQAKWRSRKENTEHRINSFPDAAGSIFECDSTACHQCCLLFYGVAVELFSTESYKGRCARGLHLPPLPSRLLATASADQGF